MMVLRADVLASVLTPLQGECILSADERDVFERVVEDLFAGAPSMTVELARANLHTALLLVQGFGDALALATLEGLPPEGEA